MELKKLQLGPSYLGYVGQCTSIFYTPFNRLNLLKFYNQVKLTVYNTGQPINP